MDSISKSEVNIVEMRHWRRQSRSAGSTSFREAKILSFADELLEQAGMPLNRRVLIAHCHPIMAVGIEAVVRQGGHEVVATCNEPSYLLNALSSSSADLLIIGADFIEQNDEFIRLQDVIRMNSIIVIVEEATVEQIEYYSDVGIGGIVATLDHTSLISCITTVGVGERWIETDFLNQLMKFQVRL